MNLGLVSRNLNLVLAAGTRYELKRHALWFVQTSKKGLFRCFLWLVSELANVWDSQVELAGSVVGGGSKVDEVLESPSHSLC